MSGLTQRFQLFQTVADLHNQGRVKLSNEEQRLIERESMDLIRKSMLNRTAEKAPPGFESVLQQLSKAPDADSAYGIIVEYLKSQGDLGGAPEPKPGLPGMDKGPEMGPPGMGKGPGPGLDMDKGPGPDMGMDKGPKPGLGKGPEMGGLGKGPGPGLDMGKSPDHAPEGLGGEPEIMKGKPSEGPMHEKKESPMEEGAEHGKPAPKPEGAPAPKPESTPGEKPEGFGGEKSEKPEGGEKPEGEDKGEKKPEPKKDDKGEDKGEKKPEKKDDKGEFPKKEREALRRRAQEQAEQSRIKNLQKEKKDFGKEITSDEMGLEATEGMPMSNPMPQEQTNVRAKKVRVHTTPSGTIVAGHIDFGPIFHAVPSEAIRNNPEELRRLANRVYGKIVYEGFMKAAKFCNAKIIRSAGVDDDVELNHVETVEPKTKGITDGAENVNREKPEGEPDSLTKDPEVVTRDKPTIEQPDVLAGRRKALARAAYLKMRRQGGDILDKAENVTKDHKPSKPTFNTGDDAETNATEQHGAPEDGVLEGGDNVIRNAQTHFQKLYATRMAKKVAAEKEAFIRRFTRAMRLAATRMLLNHEEHPFKAAAVDVLADDSGSIEFSDGQRYTGMDIAAAVELTELIAAEGHKAFLDALLTKSADLMGKDDRYLKDAESDLAKLAPVSVSAGLAGSKTSSFRNRSVSKRRAAVEGNFEVTHGTPATGPEISKTADLRGALGGGTLLGRRLERLGRG